MVCFQDNPDAAAQVRADPTLLPAAIEEVLRMRTPFPGVGRLTKVDTEVGGVRIPAGQVVLPWLAAANRDERVFAEPDRFDIHRRPNPHLTFGHGIHFCLGAPLARLEARVALRLLLQRYRDIEVAADEQVEHRNPWTMVAVTRLPLRGSRRLTTSDAPLKRLRHDVRTQQKHPCRDEAHRDDRRLRLHGRDLPRRAHRRGRAPAARRAPAPRGPRPRVRWANSARLQAALAEAGIGYRHHKELAPTTELRQLQYREDDRQGVGKRSRVALAPEYAERYTREILDPSTSIRSSRNFRPWRRAPLRRARPRGVPPLARGRAPARSSTACRSRTSVRVERRAPVSQRLSQTTSSSARRVG